MTTTKTINDVTITKEAYDSIKRFLADDILLLSDYQLDEKMYRLLLEKIRRVRLTVTTVRETKNILPSDQKYIEIEEALMEADNWEALLKEFVLIVWGIK